MINDITTDTVHPPKMTVLEDSLGRSLGYPAHFAEVQAKKYPSLGPLKCSGSPAEIWVAVMALVKRRERWEVQERDDVAHRVELIARTKWLRFRDAVVIELRRKTGSVTVHMRSKSLLGKSDFGTNATRIERFLRDLASEIRCAS